MRNERRRMMVGLKGLPSGYERLGYIDTGTHDDYKYANNQTIYKLPFIQTDVAATKDLRVKMKIAFHEPLPNGWGYNVCGGYSPNNDAIDTLIIGIDNKVRKIPTFKTFSENGQIKIFFTSMFEYEEPVTLDFDWGKGVFKFINSKANTETITTEPCVNANTSKMWCFLYTSPFLPPFSRLYLGECYHNDELQCRLIPAKRKSDGIIGMYDLVGCKFYTSPNGMKFTGGGKP